MCTLPTLYAHVRCGHPTAMAAATRSNAVRGLLRPLRHQVKPHIARSRARAIISIMPFNHIISFFFSTTPPQHSYCILFRTEIISHITQQTIFIRAPPEAPSPTSPAAGHRTFSQSKNHITPSPSVLPPPSPPPPPRFTLIHRSRRRRCVPRSVFFLFWL